jgi:hypothetical protein
MSAIATIAAIASTAAVPVEQQTGVRFAVAAHQGHADHRHKKCNTK